MTSDTNKLRCSLAMPAMLLCATCTWLLHRSTAQAGTLCGGHGEACCYDWCCPCDDYFLGQCVCPELCNPHCNSGLSCIAGFCYPPPACGGNGEVCCEPNCSCDNQWLQQYFGFCGPCGGQGQAYCINGTACQPGLVNIGGICSTAPCGADGEICCEPNCSCDNQWLQQHFGVCGPCGSDGEAYCLNGAPCRPGLVNLFGFCAPQSACGGNAQPPCTSGDPCDPWHQLVLGVTCAACGGEGQVPCLPGVSTTEGCQNNLVLTEAGTCEVFCSPSEETCNGLTGGTTGIWPGGIVYYAFSGAVAADPAKVLLAKQAMDIWGGSSANITFLPHSTETTYVTMYIGGNNADVGIGSGGARSFNLSGWDWLCLAVHEFGHTLGMWHEHSRPDRDDYVNVIWENVNGGCSNHNFAKVPQQYWLYYAAGQYDYASIMHYGTCFQSTCSDEFGQCPCTFGVCDFEDTSLCPNAGMVLVANSCDPADQAAIRDWGEGCLTAQDEFEMVQLYGAGTSIYLEAGAAAAGANGGVAHPFPSAPQAGNHTAGASLWIKGGIYAGSAATYNTPGTWRAHNGLAELR